MRTAKGRMKQARRAKKDFKVKGNKIFHKVTGDCVGTIHANGTCTGPAAWDDDILVATSPEQLRAQQRESADD